MDNIESNEDSFGNDEKKRKYSDDTSSSCPGSPENAAKPEFTSPKKARCSFNFWKKESEDLKIKDLTTGTFCEQGLSFRVTYKGALKEIPSGKLLNFNIMDETGEVAVVAYSAEAIKFSDIIEVNGVYNLKNFMVKADGKPYYTGIESNLSVQLNRDSALTKSTSVLPKIKFSFVKLDNLTTGNKVDVLGIVVKDWGREERTVKSTGKPIVKRDISITDSSKATTVVTLWGSDAEDFSADEFNCVALRRATVAEYENALSINCGYGTLIWVKPDVEEAKELENWFNEHCENN